MPDAKGNVFAFDAVTGERLWYYKPKYPKGFAAGLPTSRGVVDRRRQGLHGADRRQRSSALDQSTGRVDVEDDRRQLQGRATSSRARRRTTTARSSSARPAATSVPAARSSRSTRRPARSCGRSTSSRPASELGANTWPKKRAYLGGGAVWAPLTVDPTLGLVYVGVGNPIPYNGNVRGKGKELFTESVSRSTCNTGKYAWHFQEVHHDIWDYDTAANPLVLFDLTIKGTMRHALAQHRARPAGSTSSTARPASRSSASTRRRCRRAPTQHTWPTQPIPVGQPFAAQCADRKAWVEVEGSGRQAVQGRLHLHAVHRRSTTRCSRRPLSAVPTGRRRASARRRGTCTSARRTARVPGRRCRTQEAGKLKPLGNFFQVDGLFQPKGSPGTKALGKVVAMNMRTNTRVWTASVRAG